MQFYENKLRKLLQKNNESIQTFLALDRSYGRHQKEAPHGCCRGSDCVCLREAYYYAWEGVYQGWLADEAGVFEPVCYDGYSCGAGGEIVQNVVRIT